MVPLGIYIHFPFCRSLCTYCDFFRRTRSSAAERKALLRALHRDIAGSAAQIPAAARRVDSIYLGGGTPSLLTPREAQDLFDRVAASFRIESGAEATLEVNPEVPFARLEGYRRGGWNRLSIGLQALDDRVLAGVRRRHGAARGLECFRAARRAGYGNVNLDLIAGLPGQDPARWPEALASVIRLRPDHLSVYLLEMDKDTVLTRAVRAGHQRLPEEERTVAMYEQARRALRESGYEHYEISNFCRPGMRSRHNLKYWTDRPYLGIGPSAHGYLHGVRYRREPDLRRYQETPVVTLPGPASGNAAQRRARAEEAAILGLRLLEGVDLPAIEQRYRVRFAGPCGPALARVTEAGLLRWSRGRARLTGRGLPLANEVFEAFLSPEAA
ncbi:MAG: radical SAM family heme chaperone HemW [Acidobacteria bacterium]|nr:radical SAM family heme chaperone HemW [Acidobacteriota bacterium]